MTAKKKSLVFNKKLMAGIQQLALLGHRVSLQEQPNLITQLLADEGYHWNSFTGEWEYHGRIEAEQPRDLIQIRVRHAKADVDKAAGDVVNMLMEKGFDVLCHSPVYPLHPPHHAEGYVYLIIRPGEAR